MSLALSKLSSIYFNFFSFFLIKYTCSLTNLFEKSNLLAMCLGFILSWKYICAILNIFALCLASLLYLRKLNGCSTSGSFISCRFIDLRISSTSTKLPSAIASWINSDELRMLAILASNSASFYLSCWNLESDGRYKYPSRNSSIYLSVIKLSISNSPAT